MSRPIPMKPGKYANHNFTKGQERARQLWRQADKEQLAINEALKVISWGSTRAELHARLDRRLDAIERRRNRAREMFDDVGESFTIATMTL